MQRCSLLSRTKVHKSALHSLLCDGSLIDLGLSSNNFSMIVPVSSLYFPSFLLFFICEIFFYSDPNVIMFCEIFCFEPESFLFCGVDVIFCHRISISNCFQRISINHFLSQDFNPSFFIIVPCNVCLILPVSWFSRLSWG